MFDADKAAEAQSPESLVADFEARADRYETPCGDGVMVWRAWGEGPPLVLLHGAHGAWSHWIRNIDALARTRRVWAADVPGFGDSAMPPRGEDTDSFAEVIAGGLRQLIGPQTAVDIVAFSAAGVISAHLAALAPELVRRLILVDTGGLGNPMNIGVFHTIRGLTGEALREAHRANLLAIMIHHPHNANDLAIHLQAINTPRGRAKPGDLVLPDKLAQAMPRVKAQVDAIWGEFDGPHPAPHLHLGVLQRTHPGATLRVIPNVGHWSMFEGAEAFNETLGDMLAQPLR